jgi:peptidoglycan hydrolase-like protein with peptidoglycan-binding domain
MSGLGLPPNASATKLPWCGTGIRPLQTMLKDLDLYAGAIDGSVGTGTENAIVAAQRQFGLPTGRITKPFCGALTAAWEAKMAPPAPQPGDLAPPNGEESFNQATGPTTPGDPGVAIVSSNGEGIMAKWDALPTAGKAGVIGGGVLLIGGVGYAIYAMTR